MNRYTSQPVQLAERLKSPSVVGTDKSAAIPRRAVVDSASTNGAVGRPSASQIGFGVGPASTDASGPPSPFGAPSPAPSSSPPPPHAATTAAAQKIASRVVRMLPSVPQKRAQWVP